MYAFLLKTYQRFFHFLRIPDDRSFSKVGFPSKFKTLLALILLNFVFNGIWMLVLLGCGAGNLENNHAKFLEMPFGKMLLMGVVALPLFEEFFFRFPLAYNRNYVLHLLIALVALFAPAASRGRVFAFARVYWKKIFWVFFYGMAVSFAFLHLENFVDAKHLLLWSPILTMTQFVGGLFLGYIRIRFGLWWSWMYHGLYNLVLFSLLRL